MTKAEFVKVLKEELGFPSLAKAEEAYEVFFTIIKASLKVDKSVYVPGFGTFKLAFRKPRKGRNPRTGQEMQIPASRTVKFTPSKALKERMSY